MKKIKVLQSILLVLAILSFSIIPAFADESVAKDESYLSWKNKIDNRVLGKIESATTNERIPVWIWFSGIDKDKVEREVKEQTGLSLCDLKVENETSVSNDLIDALETASSETINQAKKQKASRLIREYLNDTKSKRTERMKRTNTYLKAKRTILSKMYYSHNSEIITELDISKNDIVFQSVLSPSAIMELKKDEIIRLAQSVDVIDIDYYEYTEEEAPLYENNKKTMRVDKVYNDIGLTGVGVNVLMNDHNFVRSDVSGYTDIINTSNINNVYNSNIYPTTNTSVLPSLTSTHANYVASVLQNFAEDTCIYSTSRSRYADIEWALLNLDIHLINGSVNYSTPTNYENDSAAKWFDGLVSEHSVALIASAGNSMTWNSGYNAPRVISPACGYNSIAVGAYSTNGNSEEDTMFNYRYSPTEGTELPCYKPDVVVAAGDTSTAAPILSGIVSLMIECEPSLAAEPETIKAILMASCHRKVKPCSLDTQENIIDGLTIKQGAGAVDAYRAIAIVLLGTYGSKTIGAGIQTADTFLASYDGSVNVSVSWLRNNENISDSPTSTNLGTLYDLELRVYKAGTLTPVGSSLKSNAGKQMAYITNVSPGSVYTIKVKKKPTTSEQIKYGYAWSEKGLNELSSADIIGKKAQGQTLTVTATNDDGFTVPVQDLSYIWQRSSDGTSWQNINGAETSSYTLNSSDFLKYIRCIITPKDLSLLSTKTISVTTDTKIVVYGDVNLDGVVTISDATEVQRYINNMCTFSSEQLIAADVDGDGEITIDDAMYIQYYVNEFIDVFPVE